ncbi:uncharacterized protein V6R79_020206 [Siganus canaliculatus]
MGKISQTKVAELKSTYKQLHNTLKRSQDSEIRLLEEAKSCRAELERLRAVVERAEEQSTSEETESEVNELRQQLLQAYNQLHAAEDREYRTQHKLKRLWEEKLYLEKENELQLKPAELENRTQALQDQYEDLRKEVAQRQLEVRCLMEDLETHDTHIVERQKELEDKEAMVELKEAEKVRLISVPEQILKEIERKRSKKEAAETKVQALNTEVSDMEQQMREVERWNQSLRVKKKELSEELERLREHVESSQREWRRLLREQEVRKEEETELTGIRGITEMKLQNVMCERKHLYESLSTQLKEKTRQMQTVKRMEHSLTKATDQLEQTRALYNELQTQLDAVPCREASSQQRMELQREVDALKVSFEKQQLVAEGESPKKQQYGLIQDLLKESNRLREELYNLRCLAKIKAEERGQKHRELLRAQHLNKHIQQELLQKDLILTDHNKLSATLQHRLAQYSKLCSVIMEEKNKYIKLKEVASQTIAELMEQVKLQENELEIQRTIVVNKDRSLTKGRMKISSSSKIRDKLRNDVSKAAWKHRQITEEFEDNKLELMKLTQMIKQQEEALLEVNKNQETAVQRRNFLGIQLLEQDEVLLNYHKKKSIQEAAISKGNMALDALETEMRDVQLAINEEKRRIGLKKKEASAGKRLEEQITTLQIELNELRGHIIDTNRRMMAASAELSMKQAAALSLQQEIREKERQMDRCQQQLEQGLPPCPEIEEEWRRMLRDKKRRQRDKEERERLAGEEEWFQLPNGEYTTAEPRPSAYIPSGGLLPLPRPYGALAPFKPSKTGANMRHFRKPALKPIERQDTAHMF